MQYKLLEMVLETSIKQMKAENFDNSYIDDEIFRKVFNGYVRKYNTIFVVVLILISMPFIAYAIARYLEMAKVDITGFLNLWHAGESLLLDLGLPDLSYKLISSGIVSLGGVSFGVVSIGWHVSCGVISVGGIASCGVISIGGLFSVGVIAIGYSNSYGLISISPGYKKFEQYKGGKAVGFTAIGRYARGVYALSYDEAGEGVYQFSPKHQDPEAISLFTRWFKKFKGAFIFSS